MELYEAIQYKGWVKAFSLQKIDDKIYGNIVSFLRHLNHLQDQDKTSYEICEQKEMKQKGMEYSVKAPYYFLVRLNDLEDDLINAGFLMGQLSLYLITKELGSCIMGIEKVKLADTKEAKWVAILGFGKPSQKIKISNQKSRNFISDKFCYNKSEENGDMKQVISAAGYAPTNVLYQPYRFIVYEDHVHILGKKEALMTKHQKLGCRLELGIMLAYMQLKSEELWMWFSAKKAELDLGKTGKNYNYMISVYIENHYNY